MKLRKLADSYIAYKRSLGMRMRSEAKVLKEFCQQMGALELAEVKPEAVLTFIGDARKPGRWRTYYGLIRSFYRYALERGFVQTCPLPPRPPKFPAQTPPYIYSTAELKRLLAAIAAWSTAYNTPLRPLTFRTLVLLLYGSAIRISEALALPLRDVDLAAGVLTIRETKFFKSRVVPIGPKLTRALSDYAERRRRLPLPAGEDSRFFCTRTGHRLEHEYVLKHFRRLRTVAGIRRAGGPYTQPRLHDIRHTSATHRLIAWYREGKDVPRLLPYISTYLGHASIESTQRYLTLTPELLQQASRRFHRYLEPENRHV